MSDSITLFVGDLYYTGWEKVEVKLSMETLAGQFTLKMSSQPMAFPIPILPSIIPGQPCSVFINGQIVITGYIDKVQPEYDKSKHYLIVEGRDKAGDLVDCSIISGTGQYKNLKIEQIIQMIAAPFGIPVTTNVDTGAPIPSYSIKQGGKCKEEIEKLCKMRQCLCLSDGKGGIQITRAGTDIAINPLIEGNNILRGKANYDYSERYGQYVVKGQKQGTPTDTNPTIAQNQGVVFDNYITRYRPLVVVADGQANTNDVTLRAQWECSTRRGKSRHFLIRVVGWQQIDAELWGINKMCFIEAPNLGVFDTLIISNVEFLIDDKDGEVTDLTLTSLEAYQQMDGNSVSPDKSTAGKSKASKNPFMGG